MCEVGYNANGDPVCAGQGGSKPQVLEEPGDPGFNVYENEQITDILIVAADPNDVRVYTPEDTRQTEVNTICQHWGYDCTCEPIPPPLPPSYAPTFPNCPEYHNFVKDVPAFNALSVELGYDSVTRWTPMPMGAWGTHIFIDPMDFGHHFTDSWKYGVKIRS